MRFPLFGKLLGWLVEVRNTYEICSVICVKTLHFEELFWMNSYHGVTYGYHIDLASKKIIKCAAIISRIRHFGNPNSLRLIYYALDYPYLTYGNLIWGNAYKSHIQKIVMQSSKKDCKIDDFQVIS